MSDPRTPAPDGRALAEAVTRGLERTLEALQQGDSEGARASAQDAAEACATLQGRGVRLDPHTVKALAEACSRAEIAADAAVRRIAGELGTAARSRRAADAYGGAPTSPHRDLP